MQNVFLPLKRNCMTGVMPTLVTGNDIEAFGDEVDDLAFSLVSPLCADNNNIGQILWWTVALQMIFNHLGDGVLRCRSHNLVFDDSTLKKQ